MAVTDAAADEDDPAAALEAVVATMKAGRHPGFGGASPGG
jgi:hypothetical protein